MLAKWWNIHFTLLRWLIHLTFLIDVVEFFFLFLQWHVALKWRWWAGEKVARGCRLNNAICSLHKPHSSWKRAQHYSIYDTLFSSIHHKFSNVLCPRVNVCGCVLKKSFMCFVRRYEYENELFDCYIFMLSCCLLSQRFFFSSFFFKQDCFHDANSGGNLYAGGSTIVSLKSEFGV